MQDTVTSRMRDLPARHGISANPSGRFSSERLKPDGSLDTGTPAEARDLAMTSMRMVVSYSSACMVLAYRQDYSGQTSQTGNHNGIGEVLSG